MFESGFVILEWREGSGRDLAVRHVQNLKCICRKYRIETRQIRAVRQAELLNQQTDHKFRNEIFINQNFGQNARPEDLGSTFIRHLSGLF